MNQRQEDHLSMYYTVRTTCDNNINVWSENVIFKAAYDLWEDKISGIEENRLKQQTILSGFTVDKANKRETMTDKALFIAKRLQSYANVSNNPILLSSVKYTLTDLKRARDTGVVGMCQIIYTMTSDYANDILPYGVTGAMITDLQTAITNFTASLSIPTVMMELVKTATENIARLFKEADELLINRMDLDIELFKTSDPDLFSAYKRTRMIISTGTRSVSVMGNVTMAETGEAMKGVVLTFVLQPSELMETAAAKPTVKKSAKKGNFRIASLPEGNYTVTVRKIGFREQVLSVIVTDGETNKMKVKMENL